MSQITRLAHNAHDGLFNFKYTPGSAVAVRELVLIGGALLVAQAAIAAGETGTLIGGARVLGPKESTAATFSFGSDVYWDAANEEFTDQPIGKRVGMATATAGASATEAEVQLFPPGGLLGASIEVYSTGVLDHADFTDGGAAVGTIDPSLTIPEGFKLLGRMLKVTEGFAGDTTAIIEVGFSGDVDGLGPATDQSVLAADELYADTFQGASVMAADTDVLVQVTGASDWGNITAGKVEVIFYGFQMT